MPADEVFVKPAGGRQQQSGLLLLEQELFEIGEQLRGDDLGQAIPIDRIFDRSPQVLNSPSFLGAGLEVAVEVEFLEGRLEPFFADGDASAVVAGRDEKLLERDARAAMTSLCDAQGAFPVAYACEGIGLAAGVEHDHGDRDLMKMQLVDHAIAGLPGQVPQQRLARLRDVVRQRHGLGIERPDAPPGCGVGGLEGLVVEHQTEAGLANAGVADQDHFGVDVAGAGLGNLSKQDGVVQFVDVDDAVPVVLGRSGVGADGGEEGPAGVEGNAGRPVTTRLGGDSADGSPSVQAPQADRVIPAPGCQQLLVAGNRNPSD